MGGRSNTSFGLVFRDSFRETIALRPHEQYPSSCLIEIDFPGASARARARLTPHEVLTDLHSVEDEDQPAALDDLSPVAVAVV